MVFWGLVGGGGGDAEVDGESPEEAEGGLDPEDRALPGGVSLGLSWIAGDKPSR